MYMTSRARWSGTVDSDGPSPGEEKHGSTNDSFSFHPGPSTDSELSYIDTKACLKQDPEPKSLPVSSAFPQFRSLPKIIFHTTTVVFSRLSEVIQTSAQGKYLYPSKSPDGIEDHCLPYLGLVDPAGAVPPRDFVARVRRSHRFGGWISGASLQDANCVGHDSRSCGR